MRETHGFHEFCKWRANRNRTDYPVGKRRLHEGKPTVFMNFANGVQIKSCCPKWQICAEPIANVGVSDDDQSIFYSLSKQSGRPVNMVTRDAKPFPQ